MTELPLTPQVFTILNALIEDRAGLSYALEDKDILASKISGRAVDAGFETALDYYYYLRYDDKDHAELDALVEALVVHETFFFRELEPLRVALERFIEPLVREGKRPRIWSAACATGEEPLSMAMLLARSGLLDKVDLIASDVSASVLERARTGRFGGRTLRHVPDQELADRYLRVDGANVYVAPELTAAVEWRRLNLVDAAAIEAMPEFDVILCRNVLIYFREEMVRKVLAALASRLTRGGVLLVGVSESLMRYGTLLDCEEHRGVFVYRKPVSQ